MSLIDEILMANDGNRTTAIAVLAHALMKGDKATIKLGYSRKAALMAAFDAMRSFSQEDLEIIALKLDASLKVDPVSYGPDENRLASYRKAFIATERPGEGLALAHIDPEDNRGVED